MRSATPWPIMALVGSLTACAPAPVPASSPELAGVVERFRPSLAIKGDAERGRKIFAKSCLHCHRAGGEGHDAGPDAAEFRSRSAEQLLVDIVDPNREVRPQYLNFKVLTADGDLVDGLLVAQDASTVTLRRGYGETDTVPRARIRKMEGTRVSLMPEGLELGLDLQQMADLLAFIRGLN